MAASPRRPSFTLLCDQPVGHPGTPNTLITTAGKHRDNECFGYEAHICGKVSGRTLGLAIYVNHAAARALTLCNDGSCRECEVGHNDYQQYSTWRCRSRRGYHPRYSEVQWAVKRLILMCDSSRLRVVPSVALSTTIIKPSIVSLLDTSCSTLVLLTCKS